MTQTSQKEAKTAKTPLFFCAQRNNDPSYLIMISHIVAQKGHGKAQSQPFLCSENLTHFRP